MTDLYNYRATVQRVIDADTLVLDIDLGFHVHRIETVRLSGIDAPERHTVEGAHARVYVEDWLTLRTSNGRIPLLVHTNRDRGDKYGRMLATIHPIDNGPSLNDWLIEQGHARPYDGGKR
jgi:micrococcal nuclease